MALAEDPSAPASLHGSGVGPTSSGVTTANFNPPANSLIVMVISSDANTSGTGATATVTDNIGNTLTPQVQISASLTGYSGIFTQYLSSAQTSYNVKVVLNSVQMQGVNSGGYIFETFVITGANPIQNGAIASATGTSVMTIAITPTMIDSYIYGSANSYNGNVTFTAAANTTIKDQYMNNGSADAWGIFRSTSITASTTSQTFGFTVSKTHAIAAYEVIPAPTLITPSVAWLTA